MGTNQDEQVDAEIVRNTPPRFYAQVSPLSDDGTTWAVFDRERESIFPTDPHLILLSCSMTAGLDGSPEERAKQASDMLNAVEDYASKTFSRRLLDTLESLVAIKRAEWIVDDDPQQRSRIVESPSYEQQVRDRVVSLVNRT